jgi:hypothetical protein
MYLKQLLIENFGSIERLDKTFTADFCTINTDFPDDLLYAVKLMLGCPLDKSRGRAKLLSKKTKLYAEAVTENAIYIIESRGRRYEPTINAIPLNPFETASPSGYYSAVRQCKEEMRLCFPDMSDFENAPFNLERYLCADKYFVPGELSELTDGMGNTATFRRKLKHFLQYCTFSPDIKNPIFSYIDAVRFWDDFKSTVNMHHEGKPLFIKGLRVKDERLIKETRELMNRQIIIIK